MTNTDELKGRAKQAAGDLTGDGDLKTEGTLDRVTGAVKEKVGDVVDAVKEKLHPS